MIIDKLLKFIAAEPDTATYADVDLKKEGHLDCEYWLVIKTAKTISSSNKGNWTLTTSDDNFTNSITLATGAIANGASDIAKDTYVARMILPFKPHAKLRLTVAASGGSPASLVMSDIDAYLVNGVNLAFEMKNMQAA